MADKRVIIIEFKNLKLPNLFAQNASTYVRNRLCKYAYNYLLIALEMQQNYNY